MVLSKEERLAPGFAAMEKMASSRISLAMRPGNPAWEIFLPGSSKTVCLVNTNRRLAARERISKGCWFSLMDWPRVVGLFKEMEGG